MVTLTLFSWPQLEWLLCSLCVCPLLGKLACPSPLCLPNSLIDSEGSSGGSRAGSLAQVDSEVVRKPLALHINGPSLGKHLPLTCCCIDLVYPVVDLLPLGMVDLGGCGSLVHFSSMSSSVCHDPFLEL